MKKDGGKKRTMEGVEQEKVIEGEFNQNTLHTYVSVNGFDKNITYQGKVWGLEK